MDNFLRKLCFLKDKFKCLRLNLDHKRDFGQVIPFVLFLSVIFSILILNNFSQKVLATAGADWTQATDSAGWDGRRGHTSVVFNNKMWVIGGEDESYNDLNDVWYSTDGVNWTQATDSAGWSGRFEHISVVFNNKMWVMGGADAGFDDFNDVWYSTDGVNWTQATASAGWDVRIDPTSVVFDNKMWVMGGGIYSCWDYESWYNDVWYSTDGVNWTQATDSAGWGIRFLHTSVVFDNKMWVMGGETYYDGKYYCGVNDVWYSTDGVNWTQATASAGWHGREAHTSVVFDNKMWVMGGCYWDDGHHCTNDVWYSTDGVNWTQATASAGWHGRGGHTSVVFKNRMWMIGGGASRNDVWYSSSDIWNP